jgi:hypothetical protein
MEFWNHPDRIDGINEMLASGFFLKGEDALNVAVAA